MPFKHTLINNLVLATVFGGVAGTTLLAQQSSPSWPVKPAYETSNRSTSLTISDPDGKHTLYEESNAVLIVEGNYRDRYWEQVSGPARDHEKLLVAQLETMGFHVLVWRDLPGAQLSLVLNEVNASIGSHINSRLFFYFYGHGHKSRIATEAYEQDTTFLVPVDAPDPTDETGFLRVAFPLHRLLKYSEDLIAKHTFFALEACYAGDLVDAGDEELKYVKTNAYIIQSVTTPDHEILTAGSKDEKILAASQFTPVLVEAMKRSSDEFVTGRDVVTYVQKHMPMTGSLQIPQRRYYPGNPGDFIFGLSERPITPKVTDHRAEPTPVVNGSVAESEYSSTMTKYQAEMSKLPRQGENGDTWTDPETGLVWAQRDSGKDRDLNLKEAHKYCKDLALANLHDWRLPTHEELETLYDPNYTDTLESPRGEKFEVHIKGNLKLSGAVWSADRMDGRYAVYGFGGDVGVLERGSDRYRALCVRFTSDNTHSGPELTGTHARVISRARAGAIEVIPTNIGVIPAAKNASTTTSSRAEAIQGLPPGLIRGGFTPVTLLEIPVISYPSSPSSWSRMAFSITFTVDEHGQIRNPDSRFKEDAEFAQWQSAIFNTLPYWKFQPATLNGTPVPVAVRLWVDFTREDPRIRPFEENTGLPETHSGMDWTFAQSFRIRIHPGHSKDRPNSSSVIKIASLLPLKVTQNADGDLEYRFESGLMCKENLLDPLYKRASMLKPRPNLWDLFRQPDPLETKVKVVRDLKVTKRELDYLFFSSCFDFGVGTLSNEEYAARQQVYVALKSETSD